MIIVVKARIAKVLASDFKEFDHFVKVITEDDDKQYYQDLDLDLAKLTEPEVVKLEAIFRTSNVQGTQVLAADCKKYLKAGREGIETVTARTVRQAAWMLEHYIASLKHHILFTEDEYAGDGLVGYYINDVDYNPEKRRRDSERENVEIALVWTENDRRHATTVTLYSEDIMYKNAADILREAGYVPETPTLMARLKEETERYYERRQEIGKKYLGRGIANADLDDASETGYRWGRADRIRLDNFGQAAPLVIDVLHEKDSEDSRRSSDANVNLYRWQKWNLRFFALKEDELSRHLEGDENTDFMPELQVPVHPMVPCFDLKRHTRLRVHVNNLTEYKYRRSVAEGLVIPDRDRRLINLLIDQSSNTFEDVVEGKGQSMNVLSGGPPGVGKTLSAEVFAEFKERPLYNIQCSQLGLDPASIEKNLSIILQRANRWNAVLLLDEADVYIRARGNDLKHNAIVGVFLRVLEYAQCILFLTTNLPDAVDDAIASRCIVALHYHLPEHEAQVAIWKNLAALNKINIAEKDIREFATAHPKLSGRDVKNLLKLASFIAYSEKRPIDVKALEFALEYKPTADVEG